MRTIIVILLAGALAGCPSSASKTEEFCERADSCNILKGSVEECVDELDTVLDDLSDAQRDELMYDVQQCLDRPSCGGFSSCVEDL
jgi:hypothetical protein